MIELRNISKSFNLEGSVIKAVDDVSLKIEEKEIFGIIGYSGAGKSTLVRLINLLETPTGGKVFVNNQDMLELKAHELRSARKKIGMIFQHFNLLQSQTVFSNIAYPLKGVLPKEQIKDKVISLLELVGLSDKANAYPSTLSGGQKQRVAIARALANDPDILLCDEATSALDPQTTKSILSLLRDLNQKLSLTIVLITHEMHVVKSICHKVAVMENGKVVEQGEVVNIFANPKEEITKEFVQHTMGLDEILDTLKTSYFLKLNKSDQLVKISYLGEVVTQPLLSSIYSEFKVHVNIIYGNIEMINQTPIGNMLVTLSGDKVEEAISYLKEKNAKVEVIKYAIN